MPTFWNALIVSSLAALTTLVGILVVRRFAAWGERNTPYFMLFAAGVLITASFLHIVPHSLATPRAPAALLIGFFGLHLFSRMTKVLMRHGETPANHDYSIGIVPMVGIGLHSAVDGIIYSVTFTESAFTGFLAAIGMILHEFPEGIVTYLLLVKAGIHERRATLLAFFAAAATTPLGMLLSYPFVERVRHETLDLLLAASAGALIYVGATHLLPRAEAEAKRFGIVALAGGVLVAVLLAATHEHG